MAGDEVATRVRLSVVSSGSTVVLSLAGELDLATVGELRACLESIRRQTPRRIVVDVGGLTFVDASGLAPLLDLRATLGVDRSALRLRRVHGTLARLLDVLALDDRLLPRR